MKIFSNKLSLFYSINGYLSTWKIYAKTRGEKFKQFREREQAVARRPWPASRRERWEGAYTGGVPSVTETFYWFMLSWYYLALTWENVQRPVGQLPTLNLKITSQVIFTLHIYKLCNLHCLLVSYTNEQLNYITLLKIAIAFANKIDRLHTPSTCKNTCNLDK